METGLCALVSQASSIAETGHGDFRLHLQAYTIVSAEQLLRFGLNKCPQ